MPDWVPQVAPDLCPRCGAYWECECRAELVAGFANVEAGGTALTVEDMQAAIRRIKDAPGWDDIPDTFNFNKLDSLGLARADDAPLGYGWGKMPRTWGSPDAP